MGDRLPDPWPGEWWALSGGVVSVVDTVPISGDVMVRWYGRSNWLLGRVEMGEARYQLERRDFVGGLLLDRRGFLPGFVHSSFLFRTGVFAPPTP